MAKVKCAGCGAKNDSLSRRCRVCTSVINFDVPDEAAAPPPAARSKPLDDHFDANVIQSQLVAPKQRFSSSGGLSARIAAANGGALPPPSFGKNAGEGSLEVPKVEIQRSAAPTRAAAPAERFDSNALFSYDVSPSSGPPSPSDGPPAPAADDHFDADALFRDMGR